MTDYSEIYLRNSYKVELSPQKSFTFSLVDFKDHGFFDRPFAIVTASNPKNRRLTPEENRERNRILYNELVVSHEVLPAEGCYRGHCEEGYLIYMITLAEAISLGSKYGQYAIFYNSGKELFYISCDEKRVIAEKKR